MKAVARLLLLCLFIGTLSVCPHNKAGLTKWSTKAEWMVVNASVVINTPVLLDVSPPRLTSLTINSEFIFDNQNIQLTTGWIRVNSTGSFIAGSTETGCQIDKKIIVTFDGPTTPNDTLGRDPFHNDVLGSKGLAVCTNGIIDVQAKISNVDWTFLSKTALKDSSIIEVETNVDWQPNDKIVIAGTDFSYVVDYRVTLPSSISWQRGREVPEQTEERTVVSVAGNKITLNAPLNFTHWGEGYEKAEVGLLTRNFVFQGDASSKDTKLGGHIIIRPAARARFQGVEFTLMGQMGSLGRYPIHYHWIGDKVGQSDDYYVQHSSVHHNFQRCVVIHNSNGILLKDIVSYDTFGHCYFLEDGGERANTFNHLLGILARPIAKEEKRQIIPTDNEPSIFWFTNPNNTVTRCSAVGGKFGFWYVMPTVPIDSSLAAYGTQDPYVRPRWTPLGEFSYNIAHSQFDSGLMVDEMVKADGTAELASYSPKKPPYIGNVQSWQLENVVAEFHHFIAYKCRRFGSWARGGRLRFSYFILLDNKVGHNSPPGANIIEHAYIVGETDNVGLAHRSTSVDINGRSRPGLWDSGEIVKGVDSYDNGGPQFYRNITCVNFVQDVKPSGCIGSLDRGPFMHHSRNRYSEFKFINSNRVRILSVEPGVSGKTGDGPLGVTFFDIDGSITDVKGGAWIVSNNSFLTNQNCTPRYDWNAYICPPFPQGFVQVTIKNPDVTATSFVGTDGIDHSNLRSSSDPNLKATFHDLTTRQELSVFAGRTEGCSTCGNALQYMINVVSRRAYTIRWMFNTPTPATLEIEMDSSYYNDWVVMAIPYSSTSTFTSISYVTYSNSNPIELKRVYKYSDLNHDTFYWDSSSSHLFIKLQNMVGSRIYEDMWGFSSEIHDGRKITIKSSCNCYASNYAIPMEPALNKEDRFEVEMTTCAGATSTHTAKAFIIFNPERREVSLSVFHDKKGDITGLLLSKGNKKINMDSSLFSPIRAVFPASHDEWTDLLKGNIELKVLSKNYPNGELCGGFKSVGCPTWVPPAKPIVFPCANVTTELPVYSEGLPGWPYWGAYVWNSTGKITTYDAFSTTEVACGKYAIKLDLQGGGFGYYRHQDQTTKLYLEVDTSVYDHFEMFVKSHDGYGPLKLRIIFIDDKSVTMSAFTIPATYIDTYKIDDKQWSRVRIPLLSHSFVGKQQLRTIQLTVADNSNQIFYVDNMRFVKAQQENMTSLMNGRDIKTLDGRICGDITNPVTSTSSTVVFSFMLLILCFLF